MPGVPSWLQQKLGTTASPWGKTEQGPWRLKPGYNKLMGDVYGMNFGLGPGRIAQRTYKQLAHGKDVSSMGIFSPIRQQAAAERSGINEEYMTGANQLAATAGGDQGNVLQRMKENAMDESRRRESMSTGAAIPELMSQSADIWGRNLARRDSSNFEKYGLLANILGQGQYKKGPSFLRQLAMSAASGAGSAAMGLI